MLKYRRNDKLIFIKITLQALTYYGSSSSGQQKIFMSKELFLKKLQEAKLRGHNIGACIRLEKDDKYLVLVRSSSDVCGGIYEMPGGSIDDGESIETAAVRELFEETGVSLEIDKLQPLGVFEFHNIETGKNNVKFAFNIKIDSDIEIILSPDHDDYKFLTKQEIEELSRQGRDEEYLIWSDHYQLLSL